MQTLAKFIFKTRRRWRILMALVARHEKAVQKPTRTVKSELVSVKKGEVRYKLFIVDDGTHKARFYLGRHPEFQSPFLRPTYYPILP